MREVGSIITTASVNFPFDECLRYNQLSVIHSLKLTDLAESSNSRHKTQTRTRLRHDHSVSERKSHSPDPWRYKTINLTGKYDEETWAR